MAQMKPTHHTNFSNLILLFILFLIITSFVYLSRLWLMTNGWWHQQQVIISRLTWDHPTHLNYKETLPVFNYHQLSFNWVSPFGQSFPSSVAWNIFLEEWNRSVIICGLKGTVWNGHNLHNNSLKWHCKANFTSLLMIPTPQSFFCFLVW